MVFGSLIETLVFGTTLDGFVFREIGHHVVAFYDQPVFIQIDSAALMALRARDAILELMLIWLHRIHQTNHTVDEVVALRCFEPAS